MEGWYEGTFVQYQLDSNGITSSQTTAATAKLQIIAEEEHRIKIYKEEALMKTYTLGLIERQGTRCGSYAISEERAIKSNTIQERRYLAFISPDSLQIKEDAFNNANSSGFGDHFHGKKITNVSHIK